MLKRILSYVGEYKKTSFITPLFMVGEVFMEILLPFLMAFIIDEGIGKGDMSKVTYYGGIMLVCAIISLFCGAMAGKTAAYASAGFAKNVRKAVFYKVQEFSFKNIDKFSTSGLVTRLSTDITNIQNAYQMVLRMCVRSPLTLICAISMTIYINPKLASVFIYAALFLGCVILFIVKKAYPMFDRVFKKYDALNASVQENITNMRVVKAYVKEEDETVKFKGASEAVYKLFKKTENVIIFNMPAMMLTMYVCTIAISWIGAHMIVQDALTTGELMSMLTYTMNILMSLMMLSMIVVMLTMSGAALRRIDEVLQEKVDLTNPIEPDYEVLDGSVEFKDVSFNYFNDGPDHLENINVKINSGETIGIIGGTGSGKSTFVSLIPRLYDITSGTLLVGGKDVHEYDLTTLRNEVSMVLQKNVLFSGTIKDNLRWGNINATDEEIIEACHQACADEFIEKMPDKYDTYIEQGGSNVSGGQKQRLCIARALLKKPKILILDDSTSAVDTRTDAFIRKAFREHLSSTTKFIISQRISSIEDADRIIVFDEGKINGIGSHEELLQTNAIYQDIYETQMKGSEQ